MDTSKLKKTKPKFTEMITVKVEPAMKEEILELCEFNEWAYAKFLRQALQESIDRVQKGDK